jgi:hypothetical protein
MTVTQCDIYILKQRTNKTNKAKSTEIGDRKVTANNYRKTRVWSTGHFFMSTWGFYVHLEMVMINPVDNWTTGDWTPFAQIDWTSQRLMWIPRWITILAYIYIKDSKYYLPSANQNFGLCYTYIVVSSFFMVKRQDMMVRIPTWSNKALEAAHLILLVVCILRLSLEITLFYPYQMVLQSTNHLTTKNSRKRIPCFRNVWYISYGLSTVNHY